MKKFLSCRGGDGFPLLVEWDEQGGKVRVTHNGVVLVENSGMEISLGLANKGLIAWQGENFHVLANIHAHLKEEYPTALLTTEYMEADAWCSKKGRKPQNVLSFMTNWIKRSRGGLYAKGGVKL